LIRKGATVGGSDSEAMDEGALRNGRRAKSGALFEISRLNQTEMAWTPALSDSGWGNTSGRKHYGGARKEKRHSLKAKVRLRTARFLR
jgi:hypothetical protein